MVYYRPETGVLVHDLHDENVVRMQETGELAVIDPFITLARTGTPTAKSCRSRIFSPF